MSEPSEEVLAIAWALVERAVMRCELAPLFAAELQKLMDERDEARRAARVLAETGMPKVIWPSTLWEHARKLAFSYLEVPQ